MLFLHVFVPLWSGFLVRVQTMGGVDHTALFIPFADWLVGAEVRGAGFIAVDKLGVLTDKRAGFVTGGDLANDITRIGPGDGRQDAQQDIGPGCLNDAGR